MVDPRQDEEIARNLVAEQLGVVPVHRDVETHLGLHDFDLPFTGGHSEALEITTATDRDMRSLGAALEKHGMDLGPAAMKLAWQVTLHPTASVKALKKNVDQLALGLASLEQLGVSNFIVKRDRHQHDQVRVFAEAFPDIKDGWGWPSSRAPRVIAVPPGATSMIGPELVNLVIEQFLAADEQQDVRDKLRKSGCIERHVFVWIRGLFGPVESLCEREVPDRPPELPEEITQVWVAAYCRDEGIELWHARPPSGWSRRARP